MNKIVCELHSKIFDITILNPAMKCTPISRMKPPCQKENKRK
jgi:hypothetical protein